MCQNLNHYTSTTPTPTHMHTHYLSLSFSFEKYSNIKFRENPSSGSWVVTCGQMDGRMYRQTDMMKLIVTFHNFVNVTKKSKGQLKQRSDKELSKLLKNEVFIWLVQTQQFTWYKRQTINEFKMHTQLSNTKGKCSYNENSKVYNERKTLP